MGSNNSLGCWICLALCARANRENFLYDLSNIDGESLQYTVYGEGEYYGWHNDADWKLFTNHNLRELV